MALGCVAIMVSAYNKAKADAIQQLYAQEKILADQAEKGITTYFNYLKEATAYLASNAHVLAVDEEGKTILREFYSARIASISNINRLDENGVLLYSYPNEKVIGQNISSQPHVKLALSSQKMVVSDVFMAVQGYRAIGFHYPVFENGKFAGTIGILIPFEEISKEFVEQIKVGKSGYAYLLSADGIELYCPVPGHTGISIFETSKDYPSIIAMAKEIVNGREGTFIYDYDNVAQQQIRVRKHAYFKPIPLENTFWSIVIATPEEEALGFIKGFRDNWTATVIILLTVFFIWGAFLVRSYITIHRENFRKASQESISRAENERERALAFLDTAIMSSPSGILIAGAPDGKIQVANPAALRMLGYQDNPGSNRGLEEASSSRKIYHPDGAPYSPDDLPLARAITQNEIIANEEMIIRQETGEHQWVSVNAAPIRDRNSETIAGIAIFQNITENKRAEEEIRQLNDELEQRVRARTAELETANKELESFAYSVSHDLRSPLRGIDGFSRILQQEFSSQIGEEGLQYLARIRSATQQMGNLIDGLLMFSRLGRQPMNTQFLSTNELREMVLGVIDEIQASETARPVEWRVAELTSCTADTILLRQVWANLLGNAFKYTRNRVPAIIEIGVQEIQHRPVFYVKDNGVGFDMKYVEKLFGVFQRLHNVETFEGTGIGLALAKRIVTRHGGKIWAEGETDHGATFYFSINGSSTAKEKTA